MLYGMHAGAPADDACVRGSMYCIQIVVMEASALVIEGKFLCMQLREKKDEAATRERFWDVTQSKIGQLTGTTAQEQAAAAAAVEEANKLSVKFGGTVVNEEGLSSLCHSQSMHVLQPSTLTAASTTFG
jgi:hypothetical protein